MNGSRSIPPRTGVQSYGDRSSLDVLNRTIEGLEARIEGLMGGTAPRDQKNRAGGERDAAGWPDTISEIMQRQRALNAGRDRIALRERVAPRQDAMPRPDLRSSEPRPHETDRFDERRFEGLRPVQKPLPARSTAAQLRSSIARPEPSRGEAARQETAGHEPARPDPAMAEIANALVGLRQELKKDIEDGLSREMNALRAEIRGITVEAAQDHGLAEDMRGDLQKLADSIGQLGRQASPAQADALRIEFDELRAMIDGLAREDSVRRMEERWTGVEDRLNIFDNSRDDELVALAYRLDDLKSQIGTIDNSPAIHALEDKLVSVAQAIELLGRHMQPDDRRLAPHFADIDSRLDEISRAIVASGRTAPPVDTAGNTRVEGRLADLSRQIDTLSQPVDTGLAARIEALTARVEELAGEEAAVRLEERLDQLSAMMERSQKTAPQPDLTEYLADISAKIDALDQGSVNDALAERLDDLARRIDQLDNPAEPAIVEQHFARLEGQLADIAMRLEETQAAPYDDSEVLRGLEAQIANLSSLVSQPRDASPSVVPAEFEGRMSALEDYLATSDEYIIEAARQAAEAVMDAYSKSAMSHTVSGGADMAAIAALADDLKVLEKLSRSSEDRTARTFEALHQTLVHIADKLEKIEARGPDAEAPQAFGTREFRDNRPVMPKVALPVFDDEEEAVAEAGPDARHEDRQREMLSMEARRAMPSRADVADAVATVAEPVLSQDLGRQAVPVMPGKKSLLSGLAKRFTGKRNAPAPATARQTVDPTPPIDPADSMAPDVANELLEPGSGVPDVKKILERVRAGQSARGATAGPSSDADKADFIAAARRAAKLAADEVDTQVRGPSLFPKSGATGALTRHRRSILMAVGAVLLVVMSYPLVNTLLRGDEAPEAAPLAVIEQPAIAETPQTPGAESAGPVTNNDDVAPLSTLQPGNEETPPGNGAAIPQSVEPAGETPATETDMLEAAPKPVEGSAIAAEPLTDVNASELSAGFEPVQQLPAQADGFTPVAAPVQPIVVPAEIAPAALSDAAKGGDPLAMFEIGAVYTEGRGVRTDLAEAAKWYQRAADAGIAPAQYRLASLYEKGTGVTHDVAKAKTLYEQAAVKGNASAMHNLAVLLASGGDAAPDFVAAGKWFSMAADLGVRDSQFNLAILYARGNGVPQDLEESYKWFAIAARDGDADAGQKRDEVATAMPPEQLASAKAKFAAWTVKPLDATANTVDVPDNWVGAGTKTSTVDMKKAVRNIQAILNNNGFDAGTPDGELGKKTIAAIKAFQTSIGQAPTGEISDALVKELLKRNA